ncbi:hypothetical protein R6Q59_018981 [Mikania micrantha]
MISEPSHQYCQYFASMGNLLALDLPGVENPCNTRVDKLINHCTFRTSSVAHDSYSTDDSTLISAHPLHRSPFSNNITSIAIAAYSPTTRAQFVTGLARLRICLCSITQEARAVLGGYEYQMGNIEATLRVFDGMNISAVTPKIQISLNFIGKPPNSSNNYVAPSFSIYRVGLLLEAAYLKSKSLLNIGSYKGETHLINATR